MLDLARLLKANSTTKEAMIKSLLHPLSKGTTITKIKIKYCKKLFKPDLKDIVSFNISEQFIYNPSNARSPMLPDSRSGKINYNLANSQQQKIQMLDLQ